MAELTRSEELGATLLMVGEYPVGRALASERRVKRMDGTMFQIETSTRCFPRDIWRGFSAI